MLNYHFIGCPHLGGELQNCQGASDIKKKAPAGGSLAPLASDADVCASLPRPTRDLQRPWSSRCPSRRRLSSLKSGQSLSLKGLSDSLGMSAMPIREALRQLEGIGVVEIIPHRGARVRPLSLDDLVDTYDARIPLERALIRRTAARMDDATSARVRGVLDRQAEALATGNFAAARSAHEDFHLTLYRAAESPWLFRLCKQVWLNSERYQALTMTEYAHVHERRLEHQAILDACQTHQPDKAEKAL
ncbi:GntR family transcriptional regulator, partial [Georgenia yuyongxinii]|uniref:GntR family transcriptional regulator n=1 Tax=Georgenia yuyongxinii TaxID=2589797 RepID=UPI00362CC76C